MIIIIFTTCILNALLLLSIFCCWIWEKEFVILPLLSVVTIYSNISARIAIC